MIIKKSLIAVIVSIVIIVSMAVPVAATILSFKESGIRQGYYNSQLCDRAYAIYEAKGGGQASFKVCWVFAGNVLSYATKTYVNSGETKTGYSYYVDQGANLPFAIRMFKE